MTYLSNRLIAVKPSVRSRHEAPGTQCCCPRVNVLVLPMILEDQFTSPCPSDCKYLSSKIVTYSAVRVKNGLLTDARYYLLILHCNPVFLSWVNVFVLPRILEDQFTSPCPRTLSPSQQHRRYYSNDTKASAICDNAYRVAPSILLGATLSIVTDRRRHYRAIIVPLSAVLL